MQYVTLNIKLKEGISEVNIKDLKITLAKQNIELIDLFPNIVDDELHSLVIAKVKKEDVKNALLFIKSQKQIKHAEEVLTEDNLIEPELMVEVLTGEVLTDEVLTGEVLTGEAVKIEELKDKTKANNEEEIL